MNCESRVIHFTDPSIKKYELVHEPGVRDVFVPATCKEQKQAFILCLKYINDGVRVDKRGVVDHKG